MKYYMDYCFFDGDVDSWGSGLKWFDLPSTQQHRLVCTAMQEDWCSVNIADGLGFCRYDFSHKLEPPPGVPRLGLF